MEKTPTNLLHWQRLRQCWPEARYLFLLRHPEDILASLIAAHHRADTGKRLRHLYGEQYGQWAAPASTLAFITSLLERLVEARAALPGLTVRYEDLLAAPETVVKGVCAHLGLPWQPAMLQYGHTAHGPVEVFLGDIGDRITSGRILPPRYLALPADPALDTAALRPFCEALGYVPRAGSPADPAVGRTAAAYDHRRTSGRRVPVGPASTPGSPP